MNGTGEKLTGKPLGSAVLLVLVFALAGCTGAPSAGSGAGETDAPGPTAARLFIMVTETDPYQDWAQFPDAQGTMASAAPHGPMARVFINAQVEEALDSFAGQLPDGSIIVKENLGESTTDQPHALTIMWKVEGYNADNNDWFWANITPDGQVNAEGRIEGCINCHSGARDNDFTFVHQF